MPSADDPIMSGRSIWLFRHFERQNLSFISDSIGIPRWLQENSKKSEEQEEEEEDEESYSYISPDL